MKKLATLIMSLLLTEVAMAQTLNIEVGEVTYQVPAAQAGDMVYSNGTSLTILNKTFSISDITKMYIDNSTVTDYAVSVAYSSSAADVKVAGSAMQYLTVTASGADVAITQSDDLAKEITYTLSGSSTDGSFQMTGSYKATLALSGLTLANADGAPIDIEDGKRIALTIDGTNTLADASASTLKGCLYIKGHTEVDGTGTLTLNAYGSKAHGIYSGEYFQIKKTFTGSINIGTTTKDGLHCGQYFQMNAGSLTITNPGDDGVQIEACGDADYDEDVADGCCVIKGGNLTITVSAEDVKGLRCDSTLTISDKFSTPVINITGTSSAYAAKGMKANIMDLQAGTYTINMAGKGIWDSDESETSACSALKAHDMTISGGDYTFTATGSGGKGISCDSTLTVTGGTMNITTSGGCYVYLNGTEYTNYTSSLDNIDTAYKSSSKGIKVGETTTVNKTEVKTGALLISGGTVNVTTSTNGAEGIECKGTVDITGGTVKVSAYDDAINSGKTMTISGGNVTVNGEDNDGLDANGDIWIKGGTIIAYGKTSPECGIDANEESNYHVYFTGGTLLAIGGGNSVPANSSSTQAYVTTTGSVTSGSQITLKSGSTTLATFDVTRSYSSSSAGGGQGGGQGGPGQGGNQGGNQGGGSSSGASILITCPDLVKGSSYTITSGTNSYTATAKLY